MQRFHQVTLSSASPNAISPLEIASPSTFSSRREPAAEGNLQPPIAPPTLPVVVDLDDDVIEVVSQPDIPPRSLPGVNSVAPLPPPSALAGPSPRPTNIANLTSDDNEVICLDSPPAAATRRSERTGPPPRKCRRVHESSSVIVVDDDDETPEPASLRTQDSYSSITPFHPTESPEYPLAFSRAAPSHGSRVRQRNAPERARRARASSSILVSDESAPIFETRSEGPSRAHILQGSTLPDARRTRASPSSAFQSGQRSGAAPSVAYGHRGLGIVGHFQIGIGRHTTVRSGTTHSTRVRVPPSRSSMPELRPDPAPSQDRNQLRRAALRAASSRVGDVRRFSRRHQPQHHHQQQANGLLRAHMSASSVLSRFLAVLNDRANTASLITQVLIHGEQPLDYDALVRLDEDLLRERNAAPKNIIDRLPTTKATKEDSDIRCVVCMCDVEEGQELRVLPCAHKYHRSCIDEWLTYNGCCPVDKQRICGLNTRRSNRTSEA